MAEFVLESVIGNLNSLVQKELGLLLGFDQDLERLGSLFSTIKATLEDAEEKQFSNRSIKDWLGKLKDAAHILDDIIDECGYETLGLEYQSDKVQCSCLSSFHPKHVVFRYKIVKKMQRISERLKEIASERTGFHLDVMVPERSGVIERPQTTSSLSEPQVYGRKENKKQIVQFLVADASHFEDLSVYPIVGLGGLGKTTLAQLIFNDDTIINHFELRIWICVSEDFSLKRMTKAIIEAVSGHACENLDLEPLKKRVQDLLQRKRYLLVFDDVWDEEQENWQRLKSILDCGAKGASILVTTRLTTVASIMGTMSPPELSVLSEKDCWELFKHQAFGPNDHEQHAELVVLGEEIVKKCRGVPLVAKALGGLLRFKRQKTEWLSVMESNLWELSHNENSIIPVLGLSYLKLPTKLRQCFSYCAIFPKNEIIEKQYLIELWIANGFIKSNERLDAQDVGDGVWYELYLRSFFQDIETDEFGKVTRFKMHDLFHNLAQIIAEDVCCVTDDNFVSILSEKIHHLSDNRRSRSSSEEANSIQLHKVKSLRTHISPYHHKTAKLSTHVLKCYSLRVLHCQPINELSSSIDHLKHLRYLNLSQGEFTTLPESLCKLWNLHILKLDNCYRLQRLPNSLIFLKALQQLSLNGCDSLLSLPPHIRKLTSLTRLTTYFIGYKRGLHLAELGAPKLKGDLHIRHMGKVKSIMDAKDANMSSKQLNKLWLSWDRNEESKLQENVKEILEELKPDTQQLECLGVKGYKGVHFPQWMSSPSLKCLTDLKLEDCENCSQLPLLGKLPSLKKLRIDNMIYLKYLYEECYDGGVDFKALESLILVYLPSLIRLSRNDEENIFPQLSSLQIIECPKLLKVSRGFQFLTHLKELSIKSCREVEGLHTALQNMTSLRSLYLRDLPMLEFLPDCFGNLPLLHELTIWKCSKLKCLPTSLSLSSLEWLHIYDCPELEKRCESKTGEDWPKIAHIPHRRIGAQYART